MSEIVISILSILLWTSLFSQTFDTKNGFNYKYKLLKSVLSKIDFKPINCAFCLSFWVGVILTCIFWDVTYMSIFLFYVIKDKA